MEASGVKEEFWDKFSLSTAWEIKTPLTASKISMEVKDCIPPLKYLMTIEVESLRLLPPETVTLNVDIDDTFKVYREQLSLRRMIPLDDPFDTFNSVLLKEISLVTPVNEIV